jgi:hypothetical protein
MKNRYLTLCSLALLLTLSYSPSHSEETTFDKIKTKAKKFSEDVKDQAQDTLDATAFKIKKGVKELLKKKEKNDFSIQALPDDPPAEWPKLTKITVDGEEVYILKAADQKGWKKLFKVMREYQKKDKLHDLYTKYYDYFLKFYTFSIFIRSVKTLEERFCEFLAPLLIDYYIHYRDSLKDDFDIEKFKTDFPPKFWPHLDQTNLGRERQTSEVKRTDHIFKATFENWNKFALMIETYQGKHEELRGKKKPTVSDLFNKYDVYFKTLFDPAKDYDFFKTTISGIGKKNREVIKQLLDAYYKEHLKNKGVSAYGVPSSQSSKSDKAFKFVGAKKMETHIDTGETKKKQRG